MKTHNRPNVTQAMSTLRLQHHWTLQEIATLFGVTREAVRLRIGNTGHLPPILVDAEEVFRRLGL